MINKTLQSLVCLLVQVVFYALPRHVGYSVTESFHCPVAGGDQSPSSRFSFSLPFLAHEQRAVPCIGLTHSQ